MPVACLLYSYTPHFSGVLSWIVSSPFRVHNRTQKGLTLRTNFASDQRKRYCATQNVPPVHCVMLDSFATDGFRYVGRAGSFSERSRAFRRVRAEGTTAPRLLSSLLTTAGLGKASAQCEAFWKGPARGCRGQKGQTASVSRVFSFFRSASFAEINEFHKFS